MSCNIYCLQNNLTPRLSIKTVSSCILIINNTTNNEKSAMCGHQEKRGMPSCDKYSLLYSDCDKVGLKRISESLTVIVFHLIHNPYP